MASNMKRRDFLKTGSVAALGLSFGCSVSNRFDIVIRGGIIYDGTGSSGIKADLGIKGNKISAIADLSTATAIRVYGVKYSPIPLYPLKSLINAPKKRRIFDLRSYVLFIAILI